MSGPARFVAGELEARGHEVPRGRLAQTLAWGQPPSGIHVSGIEPMAQRVGLEQRSLTHRQQDLGEALEAR